MFAIISCFQTVMLEETLESPLDSKEIKLINPKGNQPWIFIGRIDAEAEAPILWSPVSKRWLTGKDPDIGKDWGQEERGAAEDEMVGWHHQLNGHKSVQTLGDSEGQGSLVCCNPRGHQESETTEQLNNNNHIMPKIIFILDVYGGEKCKNSSIWCTYCKTLS